MHLLSSSDILNYGVFLFQIHIKQPRHTQFFYTFQCTFSLFFSSVENRFRFQMSVFLSNHPARCQSHKIRPCRSRLAAIHPKLAHVVSPKKQLFICAQLQQRYELIFCNAFAPKYRIFSFQFSIYSCESASILRVSSTIRSSSKTLLTGHIPTKKSRVQKQWTMLSMAKVAAIEPKQW